MIAIRVTATAGLIVMAGAILYGLASGDFSTEGAEILGLVWGRVTLIDLYIGLSLFGAWVAFRELSWAKTALWWLLLIVLGNFAAALYVVVASFRADSPRRLMMGDRA